MQIKNNEQDANQNDTSRNENKPHSRSGVDKNTDFPIESSGGGRINHELGIGNNGTPNISPCDGTRNGNLKVFDIVVYFAKTEMNKRQTKPAGSAMVLLLSFLSNC